MKPKMEGRSINPNSCRLSFRVVRRKAHARADRNGNKMTIAPERPRFSLLVLNKTQKIREVMQVHLYKAGVICHSS